MFEKLTPYERFVDRNGFRPSCISCEHMRELSRTVKVCTRSPPTNFEARLGGSDLDTCGPWPKVLPGDYCAEWQSVRATKDPRHVVFSET